MLLFFFEFIIAYHSSQLPEQKEGLFNPDLEYSEKNKLLYPLHIFFSEYSGNGLKYYWIIIIIIISTLA